MNTARTRKTISTKKIRNFWQNREDLGLYAYSEEVRLTISEDSEELRLCWCCGDRGYQEVAHIVPFSLGGECEASNMFLLCDSCHVGSPDFSERLYFSRYINRNAGKASKAVAEAMDFAISQAVEHCDGASDFGFYRDTFLRVFDQSNAMVGQHGANTALSSRLAAIEWAAKESVSQLQGLSDSLQVRLI